MHFSYKYYAFYNKRETIAKFKAALIPKIKKRGSLEPLFVLLKFACEMESDFGEIALSHLQDII